MARRPYASDELYTIAARWVDSCLRNDRSLFTSNPGIWSEQVVGSAAERILTPEVPAGKYIDVLRAQLDGSSDEVLLFAAEILYVYVLPIMDMGVAAKRSLIQAILESMRAPVQLPPDLILALADGVASYGSGNTQRGRYVRWLVRFVLDLKQAEPEVRARVLSDPWEFRTFAYVGGENPLMQREAVLHLAFPDTFDSMLAPDAKQKIVRAFKQIPSVANARDNDHALLALRALVTPVLGDESSFYQSAIAPVWRNPVSPRWTQTVRWAQKIYEAPDFDIEERDYKLVVASRLAEARRSLLEGSEWLPLLRTAFGAPNNLTHWQGEHGPVLSWCEKSPDDASRFLHAVWADDADVQTRLVDGDELLPMDVLPAPAARLSLLSLLLWAIDATTLPFYRSKVANGLRGFIGADAVDATKPFETYALFLDLLDELRIRLLIRGVTLRDRLDAQGIAWWLVHSDPPESWSADDKAQFRAFRGNTENAGGGTHVTPLDGPPVAWLVRGANVNGVNVVPEWIAGGYVSIGWHELGEIDDDRLETEQLLDLVRKTFPDDPPGAWSGAVGNLTRFLRSMLPGHLVITVDGDRIYIGRVSGPATYDPGSAPETSRRREVEWLNSAAPASRKTIEDTHPSLYSKLRTLLTVTNLREDAASVLEILDPSTRKERVEAALPAVTDQVADELFLSRNWLQDIAVDALAEKRQVIFYGPPGTGKTYIAQKLAEHLTKDGGVWELIQFHPSYSYEDFFEGYRPTPADGGGGLTFQLTPGPLRRIAAAAASDPGNPYILIVDEINRGNVAKIFGELLFLLEYRDRAIPLQYSPDPPFGLPSNLYLIGTMNTADRSIALVDAALRRRFYFVPFMPSATEVGGVLLRWLRHHRLHEEPARLLDALNDLIERDEVAIGPSYLMTRDGSAPNLERVWRNAIIPLLEEHYYGTARDVPSEFSLAALRAVVTRSDPEAPPAVGPEESRPASETT